MKKRVCIWRKLKRAGDGESPVPVAYTEDHFGVAVRKIVSMDRRWLSVIKAAYVCMLIGGIKTSFPCPVTVKGIFFSGGNEDVRKSFYQSEFR